MTTITNKKQYPSEQYLNELITNIEFAARAPVEVVRAMAAELQKRREADSAEPVAYIFKHPAGKLFWALTDESNKDQSDVIPVYAAPPVPVVPAALPENDDEDGHDIDYLEPSEVYSLGRTAGWNACRAAMLQGVEPASNHEELSEENGSSLQLRNLIRQRHAEWSDKTFGCVGPVGPLKHLSKEALEAAAEPDDLSEWADMQFLLWDAQRRAGISDAEITAAMENKLKINMERQWPEPKDGEPRLHIKEPGNSPVIPDGLSTVCAEAYQVVGVMADALGVFGDAAVQKVLDNLSQQKLVHRDVLPFSLPVTPDGWISCSERMPNDKRYVWCWGKSYGWTECDTFEGYYDWSRNKWWAVTDDGEEPASKVTHWIPLPEPPQEVK